MCFGEIGAAKLKKWRDIYCKNEHFQESLLPFKVNQNSLNGFFVNFEVAGMTINSVLV
jgi:hypothetical protein